MLTPELQAVLDGESEGCILCADCLDVLPLMPDGCVDAVVTDPPYGITYSSAHGASWKNTCIAGDSDTRVRDSALGYFKREPVAAFGTWKTPPIADTRGVLVWDKGSASGMGDLSFPWKLSWELIYVRGDGWSGRRDEGVLRGPTLITWESKGRLHPHEKPVWLIQRLLERLPLANVILDPFVGSGTTCVAAKRLGRRYIGIEISEKYAEVARNRLANTERPLFTKETQDADP